MALFELARGLAGAYNGFNEGVDAEKNRQRVDADRKYQDEQRAYQREIQDRTRAENARADKLRADLGAVPIEGRNQAEVFRDVSRVQAASGNIAEALKAQEAATAAAYKESANRFARFKSSAASMPVDQLVDSAASMFNSDYLPAKLSSRPTVNADGTIDVEIVMQDGQSLKHRFKDKGDLLAGMESWYSPDTYNAFIKAQRDALIKQQEEINKPRVVSPGATLTVGGKPVYTNPNDRQVIGETEDGQPIYGRSGAVGVRSGSGAGAAGKAPKAPIELAADILTEQFGKADGSPEMAQRNTRAVAMLEGIYETAAKSKIDLSPRTAAFIAADATADEATGKPTKVTPQLNKDTGEVEMVYRNPQVEGGRPFRVATGGSVADLERVGGKQQVAESVKSMVAELVSKAPPAQREAAMSQLVFVAKNQEQRERFLQQAASRGEDIAAWDRQLNLIRDYISLPGEKQIKSDGPLDKLRNLGGIFQQPSASQGAGAQEYVPRDGVPAELASRVSSASAAEQKRREEDAAKKSAEEKAKAESRQKKRQEIGWLTQREISVMRPSEAGEYLRKYQDVLEPELARALRRRM